MRRKDRAGGGPRDQTSPEISNDLSLFGCLRGGSVERVDPGQRSTSSGSWLLSRVVLYADCSSGFTCEPMLFIVHRVSR